MVGASDVLCLHHVGEMVISDKLVDSMFGANHDQLAVAVWLAPVTCFVCIALIWWLLTGIYLRWLSLYAIFGTSNDGHQPVPAMSFVCIE
jgi:uncharacterized membrane-anchored protein